MTGFAPKSSPEFDEWVALERERLRLQALDALSALATYHERQAEYTVAHEYARRQLGLEPWQERAHRQLMRILAREDKRAAALAAVDSADMLASAVARALGIQLLGTQDINTQVLASLRDKELLLVLDNFEHLIPAATLVSAKLQACPRLNILVTSREPLHVYGERQFLVEPLPTPRLTSKLRRMRRPAGPTIAQTRH